MRDIKISWVNDDGKEIEYQFGNTLKIFNNKDKYELVNKTDKAILDTKEKVIKLLKNLVG